MTPDDVEDKHMSGGRDGSLVERAMRTGTKERPRVGGGIGKRLANVVPSKKEAPFSPALPTHGSKPAEDFVAAAQTAIAEPPKPDDEVSGLSAQARSRTVELDFERLSLERVCSSEQCTNPDDRGIPFHQENVVAGGRGSAQRRCPQSQSGYGNKRGALGRQDF